MKNEGNIVAEGRRDLSFWGCFSTSGTYRFRKKWRGEWGPLLHVKARGWTRAALGDQASVCLGRLASPLEEEVMILSL